MPKSNTQHPALLSIHLALAVLWIYQGLVPKILFQAADELRIWQLQGLNEIQAVILMQISGCVEIAFGLLFLVLKKHQLLHLLNIISMLGLSALILAVDPRYFQQAFNPFVMNTAMATLSIAAIALIKEPQPSA
ncbi:hypothetical protein F941_00380 [Acinetobacter bouvetii DSM 14964 = CIP 107468]|uniref:DoxX family protein n=1 Tax=Acinetobacter bouvetii DSM 14964 = CIP 107468 TaxID=1120925 RepID=N9CEQ2_9GAMM|nr:DoxX-like family protein [Acinetobacter bouvetii]ENV83971.1 hypothetical protein F941_00380 [Acinetobacter bouvetii DSM 14964 = CIP 107468]BCU65968.1 hypothetical protein ACBO_27590 [Acinetobacter bouvetii]